MSPAWALRKRVTEASLVTRALHLGAAEYLSGGRQVETNRVDTDVRLLPREWGARPLTPQPLRGWADLRFGGDCGAASIYVKAVSHPQLSVHCSGRLFKCNWVGARGSVFRTEVESTLLALI